MPCNVVHRSTLQRLRCGSHAEAFTSLQSSALGAREQSALLATSARGGTDTTRQRLKRDKVLADAGAALPADSRLFKRPAVTPMDTEASDTSTSDGQGLPADLQSSSKTSVVAEGRDSEDRAGSGSHSESDSEAAGKAARDLSHVLPPVAVTFSKKRKRGSGTAEVGEQAQARPAVSADAMLEAQQEQAALIASGAVPGARAPSACASIAGLYPAHLYSRRRQVLRVPLRWSRAYVRNESEATYLYGHATSCCCSREREHTQEC